MAKGIKRSNLFNQKMKRGVVLNIKVSSIIYDENLDILELDSNQRTSHCIEASNLIIIHCNQSNKPIGVELLGVSQIFGVNKKLLMNIKSAKIRVTSIPEEKKTYFLIKFISQINQEQITTNLVTTPPSEVPLLCK